MSETERIIEPDLLDEFIITAGLSSLSTETSQPPPDSVPQAQKARLVLLQPLANAEMLESCRTHKPDNSNNELLNIQPLSSAWRRAIMNVPPFSQLIFDLTLPKDTEEWKDSFQKVHWDTFIPQENSLGVRVRDVKTLIITIATEMKIRANGDVWFDVVYDEVEGAKGIAPRAMAILKKHLLALSQHVPGVKYGEKGELDGKAGT
jgi:hypothetical protein